MSGWSDYGWPGIFFSCDLYNPVLGLIRAFKERLAISREVRGESGEDIPEPQFMESVYQDSIDTYNSPVQRAYGIAIYDGHFALDRFEIDQELDFHRDCMRTANEELEEYGLPPEYYEAIPQDRSSGVAIIGPCAPNESAFAAFYWYFVVNRLRFVGLAGSMYSVTIFVTEYEFDGQLQAYLEPPPEPRYPWMNVYFNRDGAWDRSFKWWAKYIKDNHTIRKDVEHKYNFWDGRPWDGYYKHDITVGFVLEEYVPGIYTGMVNFSLRLREITGISFDYGKSVVRDMILTQDGKDYKCASRNDGELPYAPIEYTDDVVVLGEIQSIGGPDSASAYHEISLLYKRMTYDIYRRDFLEFKDSCVTDEDPVIPEGTLIEIVNN